MFPWEKIEEPLVERRGEVRVFVPMRGEARQVRPIRRHPDGSVIETGRRQWIQRKRRPVTQQNCRQTQPLNLAGRPRQQENKNVTHADLAERVLKREIGLRPMQRTQEDPEESEQNSAPDGVPEHRSERLSAGPSFCQRKWQ